MVINNHQHSGGGRSTNHGELILNNDFNSNGQPQVYKNNASHLIGDNDGIDYSSAEILHEIDGRDEEIGNHQFNNMSEPRRRVQQNARASDRQMPSRTTSARRRTSVGRPAAAATPPISAASLSRQQRQLAASPTAMRQLCVVNPRNGRFTCRQCTASFTQFSNLRRHIRVIHQGGEKHPCRYCGKEFTWKGAWRRHEQFVHEASNGNSRNSTVAVAAPLPSTTSSSRGRAAVSLKRERGLSSDARGGDGPPSQVQRSEMDNASGDGGEGAPAIRVMLDDGE